MSIITISFISLSFSTAVFAENKCGTVNTSIISCDETPPDNKDISKSGVWQVLIQAINILSAGVGIMAVGGVVYGAILYTTSAGKPEQTKKAIGVITNTVIGLVCFVMLAAFLNFLIPGGAFNVLP